MSDPRKKLAAWEIKKTETVLDTPWFTIDQQECLLPDGSTVADYYVRRQPDIAGIIALTPDNELVMNYQYKHGVGEVVYEIPAGAIDPGEDPETAARREMEEETGYVADEFVKIGELITNPTNEPTRFHVYLALNATPTGERHIDPREEIINELVPWDQVEEKIRNGEMNVLWSISAIHLAQQHLAAQ